MGYVDKAVYADDELGTQCDGMARACYRMTSGLHDHMALDALLVDVSLVVTMHFLTFQFRCHHKKARTGPHRKKLTEKRASFPSFTSFQPPLIIPTPLSQPTMSTLARPVPVALVGLGGVGRAILAQLLSPPLANRFTLVLIANSRQSLSLPLPASPLTPTNYLPILEKYGAPLDVTSIVSVLSTHPDAPGIFIDSTGSDAIPAMYAQILQMGVHLVTPNKKAFSGTQAMYAGIQEVSYPNSPALVYGESTVGAGLPILSTLRDLVGTGDEIERIEGGLSGTLSYIFNEFSKVEGGEVKFSEVVKIAKDKGYTVRCSAGITS